MIKKLLAFTISLAFLLASSFVYAKGDISSGKAQAANCASCHGDDGNSMMSTFPKLAGQHAGYIEKQLHAFKSNNRSGPMMAPMAMALDNQAIADLAAFYASQSISSNPLPVIYDDDEDDNKSADIDSLMALGSDLYRNGNLKTKVSACIACHGPKGRGNKPSSFPSLQSQHADYLIKTLTDFKNGKRTGDSYSMMHMIAKRMTDEEIQAVSYHMSMEK